MLVLIGFCLNFTVGKIHEFSSFYQYHFIPEHMRKKLFLALFALSAMLANVQQAKACHGVPLVGFAAAVVGSNVIVNANSDPSTCGCGPYYMEVQLACFSPANFATTIPACNGTWNTYPFYRSLLNVPNYNAGSGWPDNCVLEPYTQIVIPINSLCAGTTYVLRARERLCGNNSAGPWSATFTFTTPGTPPNFWLTASAAPTPICAGQQSVLTATVNGSGGCGSGTPVFTWQAISPAGPAFTGNPVTVTPGQTTIYQVTATGGYLSCYPVPPVTVTVTVNANPVAGTPVVAPTTVCAGQPVTLTLNGYSGSIQWQSGPASNGPWTAIPGGTTSPYTYTVNSTTYFNAIVSNNCGTATSPAVGVTVLPTPTLTITPNNPSICAGQSVVLNASGGVTYTWTPATFLSSTTGASVTASPTVTTVYTVSSTVGVCTGTRTVQVTVNPNPTPVVTPTSPSICFGDSITLTCGPGPYSSVTWSNSSTLSSGSGDIVNAGPSTTQSYVATATNSFGCTGTAPVTVTVNPLPVMTVTPTSPTVCAGFSTFMTASGASTYLWNTGNTTDTMTVLVNSTTTYTVVGTSAGGCVDSTTVTVTLNPNIPTDAGVPDSICPGATSVLNPTPFNVGSYTYSWTGPGVITNPNTANATVTPAATGTYTVNMIDQNGCTGVDSVEIVVLPQPVASAGADLTICTGEQTQLNASGGSNYSWSPNIALSPTNTMSNPMANPTSTQQYIVTVTDPSGCFDTDTMVVNVNPLPAINAGTDVYICGNGAQLNATGGTSYVWTPSAGLSSDIIANPIANPASTTTYVVTGTDNNGCVNTDTIVVNLYTPLTVVASNAASICPGNNTAVSAVAGGGDGIYTYSWAPATGLSTTNAANATASPTVTTTYVVTVSDACGSTVAVDSVVVTVHPVPVLTITPDVTSGCSPVCVNFTGTASPSASVSCNWDFSDGTGSGCNTSHCFNTAGSYNITLSVIDGNGCAATLTMPNLITVHPNPVAGFAAAPDTVTFLSPVIVVTPSTINGDSIIYLVNGDTIYDMGQFQYTFDNTGTFQITQIVYTQYGCVDQAQDNVTVIPDFIIYVPNAFSPNEDGINDEFMAYGEGIDPASFQMWIYDRWGNLIFQTSDLYKGWNGKVQGQPNTAQIDTYVWKITCKDRTGTMHKYIGNVNMIK